MQPRQIAWNCRRWASQLKRVYRFVQMDSIHPARRNPGLLRRGFFSYRATFYPLADFDLRWFLSDWAIENHFLKLNPPAVQAQLNDKLYFHLLLREFGLADKMAPLVGLLVDGVFRSFSVHRSLNDALQVHERLVAKPVAGMGGAGVQILDTPGQFPRKQIFVVEAALKQHAYSAGIFPGSVNTIRVMTLRSGPEEPPFILGAGHRFGVRTSAPVDNFSRGGVVAFVDHETGALSSARSAPGQFAQTYHTHHPDTGAPFTGVTVAMWEEVKAFALELASVIPGLKLAGWDICVTPEGPRLIEGNGSLPNPELIQAHWPVLINPKAREFFVRHGVISRRLGDELDRMPVPVPVTSVRTI